MKDDDRKCHAGMDDYLTKHIDRERMQDCLAFHLAKASSVSLCVCYARLPRRRRASAWTRERPGRRRALNVDQFDD
jgi:hypothetical protein